LKAKIKSGKADAGFKKGVLDIKISRNQNVKARWAKVFIITV
jgi:HSP20 family molecular chaperone IbpA